MCFSIVCFVSDLIFVFYFIVVKINQLMGLVYFVWIWTVAVVLWVLHKLGVYLFIIFFLLMLAIQFHLCVIIIFFFNFFFFLYISGIYGFIIFYVSVLLHIFPWLHFFLGGSGCQYILCLWLLSTLNLALITIKAIEFLLCYCSCLISNSMSRIEIFSGGV